MSTAVTTESTFILSTDTVLAAIGRALDAAVDASDVDVDWSIHEGILTIECADGSKVIVNRHLPNRELWVAARTGGFHYRVLDGRWHDTRNGALLDDMLVAILREQGGVTLVLPVLTTA